MTSSLPHTHFPSNWSAGVWKTIVSSLRWNPNGRNHHRNHHRPYYHQSNSQRHHHSLRNPLQSTQRQVPRILLRSPSTPSWESLWAPSASGFTVVSTCWTSFSHTSPLSRCSDTSLFRPGIPHQQMPLHSHHSQILPLYRYHSAHRWNNRPSTSQLSLSCSIPTLWFLPSLSLYRAWGRTKFMFNRIGNIFQIFIILVIYLRFTLFVFLAMMMIIIFC